MRRKQRKLLPRRRQRTSTFCVTGCVSRLLLQCAESNLPTFIWQAPVWVCAYFIVDLNLVDYFQL